MFAYDPPATGDGPDKGNIRRKHQGYGVKREKRPATEAWMAAFFGYGSEGSMLRFGDLLQGVSAPRLRISRALVAKMTLLFTHSTFNKLLQSTSRSGVADTATSSKQMQAQGSVHRNGNLQQFAMIMMQYMCQNSSAAYCSSTHDVPVTPSDCWR